MSKIFAFLFTFFFAISSYASTDSSSEFGSESNSNSESSDSDSNSDSSDYDSSDYDSDSYESSSEESDLKRDRDDSSDDKPAKKKRRKLSKADLNFLEAAREFSLVELEKFLAEGADINVLDKDGSAFRQAFEEWSQDGGACNQYCLDVFNFFLDNEVDVHDAVFYGNAIGLLWDALGLSVIHGTDLEQSIQLLIERIVAEIEVHARDENGNTALALLVQEPIYFVIHALIDAGSDVNALNNEGASILTLAINAINVSPTTAYLLIEHGAHFGQQELEAAREVAARYRLEGDQDLADKWEEFVRFLEDLNNSLERSMMFAGVAEEHLLPEIHFPLISGFLLALSFSSLSLK